MLKKNYITCIGLVLVYKVVSSQNIGFSLSKSVEYGTKSVEYVFMSLEQKV